MPQSKICNLQLSGKPPTFSGVAYDSAMTARLPTFSDNAVFNMEGIKILDILENTPIPLLWNHNANMALGIVSEVWIDERSRLCCKGIFTFSANSEAAKMFDRITAETANGFKFQLSVGGKVSSETHQFFSNGVNLNGTYYQGPVDVINNFLLREISIVSLGASTGTGITIEAAGGNEFTTQYQQAQTVNFVPPQPTVPTPMVTMPQANVSSANGGGYGDVGGYDGTVNNSPQNIQLEYMRASRPLPPTPFAPQEEPTAQKTIEASLLVNCGLSGEKLVKLGYSPQEVDAATGFRCRGESLQSIVRRASGDTSGRFNDGTIRAAFTNSFNQSVGFSAGGFSTISLPGILSNVANKLLLSGYQSIDDPTPAISKVISVNNFKPHHLYTLLMDGTLKQTGPGGELQHVTFKETEYTAAVQTRGAIISITREMMINDDMGALNDGFSMFGRKVAIAKQRLFFEELLKNLKRFTTAAGNLIAAQPFNMDAIAKMSALLAEQVDETGDPVLVSGQYLLVPPALTTFAMMIEKSTALQSHTNPTENAAVFFGTANPFYNSFNTLKSPYFGAKTPLAGGSDTHFILFADPASIPVMGVSYLQGVQTPHIENSPIDFDKLGVAMRVYFDYGVQFLNPKGAVYCAGAKSE